MSESDKKSTGIGEDSARKTEVNMGWDGQT